MKKIKEEIINDSVGEHAFQKEKNESTKNEEALNSENAFEVNIKLKNKPAKNSDLLSVGEPAFSEEEKSKEEIDPIKKRKVSDSILIRTSEFNKDDHSE